jgi:hypothetical protein
MTTTIVIMVTGLLGQAAATAPTVVPPVMPAQAQIAATLLAAPAERRNEATVLGYNEAARLVTLQSGTNDLVCLADNPHTAGFSAACYHKDLEPFMARGRDLAGEGVDAAGRDVIRYKEIAEGRLRMSTEPRTLYVLTGDGFDAAANTVTNAYLRWVIYVPFATAETTGLSLKPAPGAPWLMEPGTAGAHIMINPPRLTN